VYGINQVLGQYRFHYKNNFLGKSPFHDKNNRNKELKSILEGQSKAHPKEHYIELDKYLNAKLKANNKKAVLSFFNSKAAVTYYKEYGYPLDFLKLGLRVFKSYPSLKNLKFFRNMIIQTIKIYITETLSNNQKSEGKNSGLRFKN
jgi:hypothetical protein